MLSLEPKGLRPVCPGAVLVGHKGLLGQARVRWAGGLSLEEMARPRKVRGAGGGRLWLLGLKWCAWNNKGKKSKQNNPTASGFQPSLEVMKMKRKILAGVQTVAGVVTVNKSASLENVKSQQ